MEQEAVLSNLLKSNFSSDISQSNLTFIGQLPNQEQVYFQAHAIAEDNDCGFHALGLDRSKAVTQLLAHAKDENIRHLVASEIQAAFIEGTLPKEMQDNEYQSLWQAYNLAWENYRQTIVEVKEKIHENNKDYFSAIQSLTPDALITWLDAHADCAALKEQLINARLNSVFPIERKLDIYCEKEETFKAFVTHYLGKGGWLTYSGNYRNKTQQTSSLDALAELNRIRVFIWQAHSSNSQQLELVHQYGKSEHPTIHMLHTHEMTHYDLLQKLEAPALITDFSSSIPLGKQEEDLLASSLMSSLDDNNHSLVSSEEKQDSIQLPPLVKKIIEEIKQAQEKVDYVLQAEAFIKLGSYYLEQKEYLYAAAIYNYVLNIYRLRLAKNEEDKQENNKAEQARPSFQKEQQKIIEKLIEIENQFIIELSFPSQKSPIDNPHSYLKLNKVHRDYLKQLREDCKQRLVEIDSQYPFDIYDEEKAKGQEDNYQQLQLEKAELIHTLYHDIAERLKVLIRQLVQECIDVLGNPPCDYAILGLGSLAREEATPYSDLEFAILIAEEKEDYKQYFRNLTKLLHLKVINLGETILPSIAIPALNNYYSKDPLENWFYDEVTPRGFAFDGAMPQACKTPLGKIDKDGKIIYELIHAPEEMAKFFGKKANDPQEKYWFDYEPHLTMILITVTLLTENSILFDNFKRLIVDALMQLHDKSGLTLQHQWSIELLKKDLEEFKIDLDSQSEQGKLYTVKKEIYRLPDRLIERLALYYGIFVENAQNRISEMCLRSLINSHASCHLTILVNISAELRLRVYLYNAKQQEEMRIYQISKYNRIDEGIANKTIQSFQISDFSILFYFYYVALPFYNVVEGFCWTKNYSLRDLYFSSNSFFDRGFKNQGVIYLRLMQYQKAKECFEKSVIAFPDAPESFDNLGMACYQLGNYKKALENYDQAHKLYLKNNDYRNAASMLDGIGVIYQALGQYQQSIDFFQRGLLVKKLLNFEEQLPLWIANSLNNLGNSYGAIGKFLVAIKHHEQAKDFFKKLYKEQPNLGLANTFANLATIYSQLNQFEKALKFYQDALDIRDKLYGYQPHFETVSDLSNLGNVYYRLGDNHQAIKYFKKSLGMWKELHGNQAHPLIANALNNLGNVYMRISLYDKSLSYYEQALEIYKVIYNSQPHPALTTALNNLGNIYYQLKDHDKAIHYYQLCQNMMRQLSNDQVHIHSFARVSDNLGNMYFKLSRYKETVECYREALRLSDDSLMHKQLRHKLSIVLSCLGNNAYEQRQYEEAIKYHSEAVALDEENSDDQAKALDLNNLGNACYASEQYRKAVKYYQQSLDLKQKIYENKIHLSLAKALDNLGNAHFQLTNYEIAAEFYQRAYDMFIHLLNLVDPIIVAVKAKLHTCLRKKDSELAFLQISASNLNANQMTEQEPVLSSTINQTSFAQEIEETDAELEAVIALSRQSKSEEPFAATSPELAKLSIQHSTVFQATPSATDEKIMSSNLPPLMDSTSKAEEKDEEAELAEAIQLSLGKK